MIPLLALLKGFFKSQSYNIDNHTFKLHYRFTVGVLFLFSLLVTTKQFFGDPISCTELNHPSTPVKVVEGFCWTHNTYSIKQAFYRTGIIYPGVDKKQEDDDIVQHKYYQWVCFVLALQAMLFYTPRYLWKAVEGECVKNLVLGLNVPVLESEEIRKKQELILRYLKSHRGHHLGYTLCYAFCECLNLINVIGQMYLQDEFLGGEFTKFGIRVLKFANEDPSERVDPMIQVFPRMTICQYKVGGPTGNIVGHDFYCILPLNIINEKIYIFLWFWFVFLMTVTAVTLVYRIVVFICPQVRKIMLKKRCPMADASDVEKVTACLSVGDWFILYQLAKNVEGIHMAELLHRHVEDLEEVSKSWTTLRSSPDVKVFFAGTREEHV